MTVAQASRARRRQLFADSAALLAIYAVIAAVAFAFVWPWLPRPEPSGPTLARYAPIRDGDAVLVAKYDASGELQAWEGRNAALVSASAAISELRPSANFAIGQVYRVDGGTSVSTGDMSTRVGQVQIVESRVREVPVHGGARSTTSVTLREPRGELLLSEHDPSSNRDTLFDPPILILPADLELGRAWESEGTVGRTASYTARGRVLEAGPVEGKQGSFDDCLKVRLEVAYSQGGASVGSTSTESWYCAGIGAVEEQSFDASGARTSRSVIIAGGGIPLDVDALPPALDLQTESLTPDDPENWRLSRVGRARRSNEPTSSTIPPLWVPTDPPMLLAAGLRGDLVAFDASDDSGTVLWRFRPGGTIYGPPAFDAARGRIYFGASDKRLHALDARGLFLWSFETGDSVATRPVVTGDTVVFGSEDSNVYGVDASTGELRWRASTGGAVVSSPALVVPPSADSGQTVVVIGSDDGGVYGLDSETGERLWLYTTGKPIEAPIVHADGTVYVASRDGNLAAVDAATGDARWTTHVNGPYEVLRSAPVVTVERVFIVDASGFLTALDRQDGRRLWISSEGSYVGPPVVVGETLLVADRRGSIHRLDFDGVRQGQWTAGEASSPADSRPDFLFGPTSGGGAVWLADDGGVVRRLGPTTGFSASTPLRVAWFRRTGDPPFGRNGVLRSPAEYHGMAVVLDTSQSIHLIDPASGRGTRLGAIVPPIGPETAASELPGTADPIVAGDTLLAVVGETLYATRLTDGTPLWHFQGTGPFARSPTVAGDTVIWLTQPRGTGASGSGTLHALDLASGAPHWQAPTAAAGLAGGALVHGDTVYTSTPPAAFDLASGQPRWEAPVDGAVLGGPALSATGDTLFVALISSTERGAIVALDTRDGHERWRADLGRDVISLAEQLWLSGTTLVLPTSSGKVVALDAASGAERWRHEPAVDRFGGITVDGGRVWLVLSNGRILALDVESGLQTARFSALDLNLAGAGTPVRPATIGGTVIVSMGTMILGLEDPR